MEKITVWVLQTSKVGKEYPVQTPGGIYLNKERRFYQVVTVWNAAYTIAVGGFSDKRKVTELFDFFPDFIEMAISVLVTAKKALDSTILPDDLFRELIADPEIRMTRTQKSAHFEFIHFEANLQWSTHYSVKDSFWLAVAIDSDGEDEVFIQARYGPEEDPLIFFRNLLDKENRTILPRATDWG